MRSESYRRWVASQPCIRCGIQGRSQHAHSNQMRYGKGGRIKASDYAAMPLCADQPGQIGCHSIHDRFIEYGKQEAQAYENGWIVQTMLNAIQQGVLR